MFTVNSKEADVLRAEASQVVQNRIKKRKRRILEVARIKERITNDDVEDLFCISDSTAGKYLRDLVAEKKLEKVGDTGRGVYYKVI